MADQTFESLQLELLPQLGSLTPKQREFCRLRALGKSLVIAYRGAFESQAGEKTIKAEASKLNRRFKDVIEYLSSGSAQIDPTEPIVIPPSIEHLVSTDVEDIELLEAADDTEADADERVTRNMERTPFVLSKQWIVNQLRTNVILARRRNNFRESNAALKMLGSIDSLRLWAEEAIPNGPGGDDQSGHGPITVGANAGPGASLDAQGFAGVSSFLEAVAEEISDGDGGDPETPLQE